MATNAAFASSPPFVGSAQASATANIAYVSPGATGQASIFTAGAGGAQIVEIDVLYTGTTVSGQLNIWRWVGGTGTTYALVDSFPIPASGSGGTRVPRLYPNLFLDAADVLTVTSTVASQLAQVTAYGGNF